MRRDAVADAGVGKQCMTTGIIRVNSRFTRSLALLLSFWLSGVSLQSIAIADTSGHYERALQHFDNQDYDGATIEIRNVLQEDPEHLPGKILLGRLYFAKGQYAIAILEFEDVLKSGVDLEMVLEPFGQALLATRQYEKVLFLGADARLSSEARLQYHLLRGAAFAGLENTQKASEEYARAVALAPNDPRALNGQGEFFIRTQQIDEAGAVVSKSLTSEEANFRSWHLQGQIYKAKGEPEMAAEAFARALDLNAADTVSKRAMASLAMERGDYVSAGQWADKVLADAPDDAMTTLLKARLLLMSEDSVMAKQLLNELNDRVGQASDEFVADNPWVLFIGGLSHYLLENYALASRDLNAYLLRNEDDLYAISVLAQTYLKQGRKRHALELLEQHRAVMSEDPALAALLCDLYLEAGSALQCDALLEHLQSAHPDSKELHLARARQLVSIKQHDEAIRYLQDTNRKWPSEEVETYLARLYVETNQPGKAMYVIRGLLAQNSDNPDLLNMLAGTLIQTGDLTKADRVLAKVFELNPYHFGAKFNQALSRLESGKSAEAATLLEPLLHQQPQNEDVRLLFARAQLSLGNSAKAIELLSDQQLSGNENVASQEMLAVILKNSDQYEQSLAIVDNLLKNDPSADDYRREKVELLIALKQDEKARRELDFLFVEWEKDAKRLTQLAELQRSANDLAGARKSIDTALQVAPELRTAQLADIELLISTGDTAQAAEKVAALKTRSPDNIEVILIEAELLLSQRQFDQAQSSYARAFAMDISNGVVLVKMYNLASKGIQPALFETQVVNALERQPGNYYYRNLYADYLLLNRRFTEAKREYLRIKDVAEHPNKADLLNNLALSSMPDDMELARASAAEASRLKPGSSSVLDTYGWILARQKQYSQALDVLRRAQAIDATDPAIRYHLGYTLYHSGRAKEGLKEIQSAVSSERIFWEREDARKLLASLQSP